MLTFFQNIQIGAQVAKSAAEETVKTIENTIKGAVKLAVNNPGAFGLFAMGFALQHANACYMIICNYRNGDAAYTPNLSNDPGNATKYCAYMYTASPVTSARVIDTSPFCFSHCDDSIQLKR